MTIFNDKTVFIVIVIIINHKYWSIVGRLISKTARSRAGMCLIVIVVMNWVRCLSGRVSIGRQVEASRVVSILGGLMVSQVLLPSRVIIVVDIDDLIHDLL